MNDENSENNKEQDPKKNSQVAEQQVFNPNEDNRSEVHVRADSVDDDLVTWEASEYINHQKSPTWYVLLTVATVLLATLLWFLLRDFWSLLVVAVMYVAISVYARREPRVLRYSVGGDGLSIGERKFDYNQFKSFSVMQETGVPSISLDPTQRFMPAVSIYFAPQDSDKIIYELSKFLPMEQKAVNAVDKAMLKLRF